MMFLACNNTKFLLSGDTNSQKVTINTKIFVEVENADSGSGGDGLNVSDAEAFLADLLRKHFAAIEYRY
jgi:hypothetical protein